MRLKTIIWIPIAMLVALSAWAVRPIQTVTRTLPNGQNGVAYSSTLRAKYGTKPYTWTKTGSLPTGLSLNASTGAITGTPSANGSFPFVITVTDNGAVTDNRNFTITVAGGAVVTPVSITTTSLPAGTNGVAYSANLQAANGTAPYSWSVASGSLPAGVALNGSTGAITGTPTAAGTVSPTFRVTDANPATADRALAVTIAAGTPTYLFSDDFESGNFSAWSSSSGWTNKNPAIAATPTHGGSYSYGQLYSICGDSLDPACGSAHQDLNRYISKNFADFGYTTGIDHLWFRGYVYFKTPEADATTGKIVQRKIVRLTDLPLGYNTYEVLLQGWSGSGGVPTSDSRISLSCHCGTAGAFTTYYDLATVAYNTWTRIEIEVLLNTPGSSDGTIKVYVGASSTPVYSNTAMYVRNTKTNNLKYLSLGAQVDRTTYYTVDEYRYWDDVIINNSYIGP